MDRRHFLASVASLPSLAWANPPSTATRPALRNAANLQRVATSSARLLDPALSNITGYALFDVSTGEVLDSYQPDLALPPASVSKAITAVYARQVLGSDYRFATRLFATGPVVDGTVQGDLYLVGGGDPALDTDELAELAKTAISAGVRSVAGRFFVDGSALPDITEVDPSQPDYLGYNPSINGLNLNFNRVYFEWKQTSAGYNLSLDARGIQNKPLVRWIDIRAENRGAPVFEYAMVNGHDRWTVAKSALGDGGGRWLPVRQPADYVGEIFRTLAASVGLSLPSHKHGKVPAHAAELAQFESNRMDEVLQWMLKYSNNLTAECIGLTASHNLGGRPLTLATSAGAMGRWVRLNLGVAGVNFKNHSGLTDRSRVSAAQMAGMLAHSRSQDGLSGILKSFNLVDRSGNSLNAGDVSVHAKTGTLNFTRGLAGYLEKGDRKYSFAILSADLAARANIPLAERERPRGAKTWRGKAKRQEQALLRHWLDMVS
ncbi:D-alanyl-D-alanine carboxypeptidase/D-alanyl-D-alanine-endopeptidase [Rhodobacterales bacterium 52_120_T64]|nr:D-alanyl-D-alanine carboxypeptidase/D-alanyl-D-alanine-endopeptidase [Rhodobacterales bacterium 52_120_T64]